jgi:MscS family membrane protein
MMGVWEFLDQQLLGNSYRSIFLFFLILSLGYLLRTNISRLFSGFLYRFFKRFSNDNLNEEFKALLLNPFRLVILLLTLYIALAQLNVPPSWEWSQERRDFFSRAFNKIYAAGFSFGIAWIVLRFIDFIFLVLYDRALKTEDKSDDQIVLFMKDLVKILFTILAIFFVLGSIFNFNITSLIAGLGIGGLAVALAAQDTLSNLLGSFIIFLDKPFKAGDQVSFDNITGTVEKVGFRSTQIRTSEKSLLTVPNKKIIEGPLNNITLSAYRRVSFTIGLTYGTPSSLIKKIIGEISEILLENPQTGDDFTVIFSDFSASSLDISIEYLVMTNQGKQLMRVKQEVNFQIMEIVEKNNCAFAFPTQTIYLHQEQKKNIGV